MRIGKSPGVTLTELMIATAILAIGVIGLIGAFNVVQKGLLASKQKTLARNLAQEKMQILREMNYYALLVTASPASYPGANGVSIPYDPTYFPPENITEGGGQYTRLTYVQSADENSGSLVILPPGTPDAGMRLVTVSVVWTQGSTVKQVQLSNVISNPNTVMSNTILQGHVQDASSHAALNKVLVAAAQDLGYQDWTNGSGDYSISLSPGGYNLVANVRGYYVQNQAVTAVVNQATTVNFNLQAISSGSVLGTAWMTPNPLISQVVIGTTQANGFVAEYVELFNPTTYPITIGASAGNTPPIQLNVQSTAGTDLVLCNNVPMAYYNTTISSAGYYVFANTRTFTAGGAQVNADAVFVDTVPASCATPPQSFSNLGGMAVPPYPAACSGTCNFDWNTGSSPPVKMLLNPTHNGAFWLSDQSGRVIDAVGWLAANDAITNPGHCEGNCLSLPSAKGLQIPEQLVRRASTAGVSGLWGPAYDSGDNSVSFATAASPSTPPGLRPHTSASTAPVVAGAVPYGAVISANDGLSLPFQAVTVGNPPYVAFFLTQVATGTWKVFIDSGNYELENDTVTLAASGSTYVFPSSSTFLNVPNTQGFISGTVTDVSGAAIPNPGIQVDPGAAGTAQTASYSNGSYLLRVTPGSVDVTANPNSLNSSYITLSSAAVPISLGAVHSGVNFMLSQGGRITGFVTRDGTNALPGVAVAALDSYGQAHDQEISASNGYFTTKVLSTGTYTLQPALDTLSSASPASVSVTVNAGQVVWGATFTVTGALARIVGNVTYNGAPVKSGALLVATTGQLNAGPPAISTANLISAPYYMTSSQEDGTYQIDVRQSSYRIYCYYWNQDATGASTLITKTLGANTTAGFTVSPSVNCVLP